MFLAYFLLFTDTANILSIRPLLLPQYFHKCEPQMTPNHSMKITSPLSSHTL